MGLGRFEPAHHFDDDVDVGIVHNLLDVGRLLFLRDVQVIAPGQHLFYEDL